MSDQRTELLHHSLKKILKEDQYSSVAPDNGMFKKIDSIGELVILAMSLVQGLLTCFMPRKLEESTSYLKFNNYGKGYHLPSAIFIDMCNI